jgi:hypothetical protein
MLLSILELDVELVTIQIASSAEFSPLKTCHQVKTGLQFREKKRKKNHLLAEIISPMQNQGSTKTDIHRKYIKYRLLNNSKHLPHTFFSLFLAKTDIEE